MSWCGARCRSCSRTISSSILPRASRSGANGSSATGSRRRCRGGSIYGVVALTGSVLTIYLLGPIASAIAIYAVWRLGREVTTPLVALIAALALEGAHYYNFSAVKF